MKALRTFAALFVALTVTTLPLLVVSIAWASPLDDAQAALYAGQQELNSATASKDATDALVVSTYKTLTDTQAAVAAAQTDYDTNLLSQVSSAGLGLSVDIYNNIISRTPEAWQLCRHDTVTQIAANWGGGSVMGCNPDWVTVHYYGTITVPTTGQYIFRNIADDGFYMTIDGHVVINDWRDKGCGGNWGSAGTLEAGKTYTLDAWFYENGGGACSTLYSQGPGFNGVVPAAWFGTTPVTTLVHDPAKLDTLTAAQSALASAQKAYDDALAAQVSAAVRLQAANDVIPALEKAVLAATPVVVPPTSIETPTPTAPSQSIDSPPEPTVSPAPEIQPTPTTSPEPLPSQSPSDPIPVPVIPLVPPVVTPPVLEPVPQPQPIPFPVVQPPVAIPDPVPVPVEPAPVPVVTPEPVPTVEPVPPVQPTTAPQPSPEPVLTPEPTASAAVPPQESIPEVVPPIISPSEPPIVEPTKDVSNIATVDLKAIDPQELSTAQVAQLISAAVEVLATASEGSPQYEKALDALAVAAQADDPQVPEELASIPGVGAAAVAVLNAFNALGNFGADMSPAHRATAKKEVVAAIVLTQVTSAAVGAATSAASSPSSRKTK